MGVSIFSGAITTFGAGIFLFGAKIIVFNKFAIMITSTIMFSVLYSLFYFAAIMHAVGPQYDTGNIHCFKKIGNAVCGKCCKEKGAYQIPESEKEDPKPWRCCIALGGGRDTSD